MGGGRSVDLFSEFEAALVLGVPARCVRHRPRPDVPSSRRGLVWGCRSRLRSFRSLLLPSDVPIGGRGAVGVDGG